MEQSRLYQAVRQLKKRDFEQFSKWLQSPYHNQDQALCRFWEYLTEVHLYLQLAPEKEKAFAKAYPNRAYQAQQMRLLMSRLYKQLEYYLAWREMELEGNPFKHYLAKALRKRKLWGHFKRVVQQSLEDLNGKQYRNATYYNTLLQLQEEAHNLRSANDPTDVSLLHQMAQSMDQAYLIQRLRQSCLLLAHSSVYQSEVQDGLLETILPQINDTDLLSTPGIKLYYNCYQMLKQLGEDTYFLLFQQSLFEHGQLVSPTELRDLYLLAINHCVRRVNDNKSAYYQQLYMLYQKGLETGALIENKILSRFTYHNIVTTGLRINEYEWVDQFIRNYQSHLERPYRESSYSFCRAHLLFHQKEYDEALLLLQKANYRDLLLNLGAKTLQLKIYYETEATDLLEAHLDAMANYIRRKKVIGYHRTNYLNIIRYTRKLLSSNPYEHTSIKDLIDAINKEKTLTEKGWLGEKATALINVRQ